MKKKKIKKGTAVLKNTVYKKTAGKTASGKTSTKRTAAKKPFAKRPVSNKIIARKAAAKKQTRIKKSDPVFPEEGLPQGYNEDTIVIMPVNAETNFIYWEITESTLKRKTKKTLASPDQLRLKVFDEHSGKDVYAVNVNARAGKHYMGYTGPAESLVAEIGVVKNRIFSGILISYPVILSSPARGPEDTEIWMTRTEYTRKTVRIPTAGRTDESGLLRLLARYYHNASSSM